jgi:hypothetical protein
VIDEAIVGSIEPVKAIEKEISITAKQKEMFLKLERNIQELQQRLNVVFATVCAGHDGTDNARFVRWGDGKDGVFTLVVSVPSE